jgi:hypothetical protein
MNASWCINWSRPPITGIDVTDGLSNYCVKRERDGKWERNSELIAIAKARVWASEGWQVEIIEDEGEMLDIAEFESPVV